MLSLSLSILLSNFQKWLINDRLGCRVTSFMLLAWLDAGLSDQVSGIFGGGLGKLAIVQIGGVTC